MSCKCLVRTRTRLANVGCYGRWLKRPGRCAGFALEFHKYLGDFENGAILLNGHVFAERSEGSWLEHTLHAIRYIFEGLQYNAYTLLLHPLRVVALLRERPGIALDEDRQLADHGFRNAPWTGLADQKIRCVHQPMHFFGETDNVHRQLPLAGAQFPRQLFVSAANQYQLQRQPGGIQFFRYLVYRLRTVPAEERDGGRQALMQSHLSPQRHGVGIVLYIKIRAQDHSGGQKNVGVVMAHGARLIGSFFRTGNDVLILDRLDPESRREISQISDDGDERPARINLVPALANLPVEMRDYGDEQVRGIFAPELFKKFHKRPVKNANGQLKNTEKLRAAESPAFLQHDVVLLLNADAGQFAQDVQPVG